MHGWRGVIDFRVQISTSVKHNQIGYPCCWWYPELQAILLAIHNQDERRRALLALPALAALFLVFRHIRRRMVKLTILEDRLRYEAGFLSNTSAMELSKSKMFAWTRRLARGCSKIALIAQDGGRIQPNCHAFR